MGDTLAGIGCLVLVCLVGWAVNGFCAMVNRDFYDPHGDLFDVIVAFARKRLYWLPWALLVADGLILVLMLAVLLLMLMLWPISELLGWTDDP